MKGNTEYSYLRNIHANKRVKIKKQSTHINKWQKMLSFPPYASKSYPMSPFKPSQRLHCTTECRENSCASSINNLHEYFSVTTLWFIRTNYCCIVDLRTRISVGELLRSSKAVQAFALRSTLSALCRRRKAAGGWFGCDTQRGPRRPQSSD